MKSKATDRRFFSHPSALVECTDIGEGTRIWAFAHIMKGSVIGRDCNIGDHCYIEEGVHLGNAVVIKNGVSIWKGVTLEDRVFVGPNVAFTNDLTPRAKIFRPTHDETLVQEGASLGANATLISPVRIGRHALIGAGSVVTRDVPDYGLAYGVPARLVGFVCQCGMQLPIGPEKDGVVQCACGRKYVKSELAIRQTDTGAACSEAGCSVHSAEQRLPNIPLVDLHAQHHELRAEIQNVFSSVVERSSFVGGSYVDAFEKEFAAYCGTNHCIACATGTDALKLALMAAGVKQGDEVITVPHTFIATVEAISLVGAYPAFVDIEAQTYTISPTRLALFLERNCGVGSNSRLVNRKTNRPIVAVMPVHLYGLPADVDTILEIASRYNLKVIEDACQAHGAALISKGRETKVGTFGQSAAFSFYPGKNLGALGEGGAVVTQDLEAAQAMRLWRDHGQREKYIHVSPDGWNSRLDALQCGVLSAKLQKLDTWNALRRRAAQWYRERLVDDERIVLPAEPSGRKHVYHLFVVRLPDRDKVQRNLAAQGISTGLHYPVPLHLQPAYQSWGWSLGDFPESEAAAATILSLPIYPHIQEGDVDTICSALKNALA